MAMMVLNNDKAENAERHSVGQKDNLNKMLTS